MRGIGSGEARIRRVAANPGPVPKDFNHSRPIQNADLGAAYGGTGGA